MSKTSASTIEMDETAKEFLVEKGYDPQFGARPLRRAIQKYVEDPMAESILSDDLGEGDTISVSHKADAEEMSFKTKKGKKKAKAKKADDTNEPEEETTSEEQE